MKMHFKTRCAGGRIITILFRRDKKLGLLADTYVIECLLSSMEIMQFECVRSYAGNWKWDMTAKLYK